jgi:hypothetical protein
VALVVVGVQLNDMFKGNEVPRLCAVGKEGSAIVNPLTCALEKFAAIIIAKSISVFFIFCIYDVSNSQYCGFPFPVISLNMGLLLIIFIKEGVMRIV